MARTEHEKDQRRARERRKAMDAWQEGKRLGGNRYPRKHPWHGDCKPTPPATHDEFERIVALGLSGPGHPQAQSHPWRRRTAKGEKYVKGKRA